MKAQANVLFCRVSQVTKAACSALTRRGWRLEFGSSHPQLEPVGQDLVCCGLRSPLPRIAVPGQQEVGIDSSERF